MDVSFFRCRVEVLFASCLFSSSFALLGGPMDSCTCFLRVAAPAHALSLLPRLWTRKGATNLSPSLFVSRQGQDEEGYGTSATCISVEREHMYESVGWSRPRGTQQGGPTANPLATAPGLEAAERREAVGSWSTDTYLDGMARRTNKQRSPGLARYYTTYTNQVLEFIRSASLAENRLARMGRP